MSFIGLYDIELALRRRPTSGLGQAPPAAVEVVVDERLVPWLTHPDKAPETEAVALLLALEALKDDEDEALATLRPATEAVEAWRARIAQRRMVLAELNRGDMSGVFDKVRKVFSDAGKAITAPIKKIGKQIDKNVFQPIAKPISENVFKPFDKHVLQPISDNVLKPIDKAVFRPTGDAIQSAGRAIDKAAIRPITSSKPFEQAIKQPLKKVEKYTVRPAGREVAKGIEFLDKYVPGWATVLDYVMPIPIGAIVGQATKVLVKGDVMARLVPSYSPSGGAAGFADQAVQKAFELASPATIPVARTATSVAAFPLVNQFPLTVTKGTATFLHTKGDFLAKIQATAVEALNGFALVVQIATVVVSGGALAAPVQLLSAMLGALQAGLSVVKAQEAAKLLREQARAVRDAAAAEAARLAAEDAILEAEIKRLEEQIARIRRDREALLAQQQGVRLVAAEDEAEHDVEEVDQQKLLVGTLLAVGGLVVLAVLVRRRRRRARK